MVTARRPARRPRHDAPGPTIGALADLTPDPANRRAHNPRNLAMLADALRVVGASRSIVVDEDDVILAGNGVVEAASAAGLTKLQIVEADGETIIAVRRRGLTPAQKRQLAIYDNRTAELAEWNVDQLAADLQNGEDLSAFFLPGELAGLLGAQVNVGLTDPDDVPEVHATDIQLGDLFELGAHRLLCGDSTHATDVARLMGGAKAVLFATDPPYAVEYQGGSHPATKANRGAATRNKDWSASYQEAELGEDFYRQFMAAAVEIAVHDHAAWYCWHASRRQAMVERLWIEMGAFVHQQIIWVKNRPVLTYSI